MRVRINNQPTAKQKEALRQECIKEFDNLLDMYNRQVALQVLHILRFDYGFGQKRLKEFSDKLAAMQSNTIIRYEVENDDVPDICEIQLRESGIDISEFVKG
jgi:hypothetical protein